MFEKPTFEQLSKRYTHHPPKGDQAERMALIRKSVTDAAFALVDVLPSNEECDSVLEKLDTAMMLSMLAIEINESDSPVCSRCKKVKDKSMFWADRKRRSGLSCRCKSCVNDAKRERGFRLGARSGVTGRKPIAVTDGSRWCGSCKSILPADCFSGNGVLASSCKKCKRFANIRRTYGLSEKEYTDQFEKQNGVCAICETREAVYVDHCHGTGLVRGILCQPCNTALGAFFEDEEIFARAVEYINTAAIARNE